MSTNIWKTKYLLKCFKNKKCTQFFTMKCNEKVITVREKS